VLPYHLDAVKQIAGCLALRHTDEMNARVATVVDERERISADLARLPLEVFPSGANFVLFRVAADRCSGRIDGHQLWQALVERSILVRDCSSWPRLDDCLRVTVGTREENDAFLAAIADVFSRIGATA
jgi:histidinol-phosphate aminotransferase